MFQKEEWGFTEVQKVRFCVIPSLALRVAPERVVVHGMASEEFAAFESNFAQCGQYCIAA